MFMHILSRLPSGLFETKEILCAWKSLFVHTNDLSENLIAKLNSDQMDVYDDGPLILKILSQIMRQKKYHYLLTMRQPLSRMCQWLSHRPNDVYSPSSVYRTEIISEKDLIALKSSTNALISISTFLITRRSIRDALAIARSAANNGLAVILFEVELSEDSQTIYANTDHVLFNVETVFQINSVDQGPDDVWYVKTRCSNWSLQSI